MKSVGWFYSPNPIGVPEFMSRLKGNSSGKSLVVSMTMLSIDLGKPGKLTELTPSKLCKDGLNWPDVLWLSAGGTNFSFYLLNMSVFRHLSRHREYILNEHTLKMKGNILFQDQPES